MNRTSRAARHAAVQVTRLVRQAMFDTIVRLDGGDADGAMPALTVERAGEPVAPAVLAASHPAHAHAREQACALYARCLAHYRSVVRGGCDDESGTDDVGAAVAHFVAANMHALYGMPVTPPMLLRLRRQLLGVARHTSGWDGIGATGRQLYFEKMAILAVLIGETAAHAAGKGPEALEPVQRAARGYLHELLGLDPDHLTLGPDGLAPRPVADAAAA